MKAAAHLDKVKSLGYHIVDHADMRTNLLQNSDWPDPVGVVVFALRDHLPGPAFRFVGGIQMPRSLPSHILNPGKDWPKQKRDLEELGIPYSEDRDPQGRLIRVYLYVPKAEVPKLGSWIGVASHAGARSEASCTPLWKFSIRCSLARGREE